LRVLWSVIRRSTLRRKRRGGRERSAVGLIDEREEGKQDEPDADGLLHLTYRHDGSIELKTLGEGVL
jgi:hypothetical protein